MTKFAKSSVFAILLAGALTGSLAFLIKPPRSTIAVVEQTPSNQQTIPDPQLPQRSEEGNSQHLVDESESLTKNAEEGSFPVWPETPDVMEFIILDRLREIPELDILSISPAHCDESSCEVSFLTSNKPNILERGQYLGGPPFDRQTGWSAKSVAPNIYSNVIEAKVYRPPTREESEVFISELASGIRTWATQVMPPDSIDAPPVENFYTINNSPASVENVCSIDCPLDAQQVIYYSVPDGKTCEQIDGTEETILTRSPDGGFEERRFCIPNLLLNN